MCECGCFTLGQNFKLKAHHGWYVVRLLTGCGYCGVGPSIVIESNSYYPEEEIQYLQELPMCSEGASLVVCGPNESELKLAMNESLSEFIDDPDLEVDEVTIDMAAEDLVSGFLGQFPKVVEPKEDE